MVSFTSKIRQLSRWKRINILFVLIVMIWAFVDPRSFVNLWLTQDQQGWYWFNKGDYNRAARTFEDSRWRGFSLYASEDFATAESYFSQYQDAESLLARANSLAHQMKYEEARQAYIELAQRYPEHPAPAVNVPVIEMIIASEQMNAKNEKGEENDEQRKPGSNAEASKGGSEQAEQEQLSADQLLQDAELTEMWFRQILRDPSEFLVTKFYMQIEQEEEDNQ
jgi:Ca-activated chloride channel family protein